MPPAKRQLATGPLHYLRHQTPLPPSNINVTPTNLHPTRLSELHLFLSLTSVDPTGTTEGCKLDSERYHPRDFINNPYDTSL